MNILNYYKIETGAALNKNSRQSRLEKELIRILEYIGINYFKTANHNIKMSNLKRGITYISKEINISKTAIKLWCKTVCKSFFGRLNNTREYVYVHIASKKIFEEICKLASTDIYLRNLINSSGRPIYTVLAKIHYNVIERALGNLDEAHGGPYSHLQPFRNLKNDLDRIIL